MLLFCLHSIYNFIEEEPTLSKWQVFYQLNHIFDIYFLSALTMNEIDDYGYEIQKTINRLFCGKITKIYYLRLVFQ